MPRNGSGVYSLPSGSTAVPNTPISSATQNAILADLVADLNAARPVVAGGTGATTAADARVNLGATSTGSSLITAVDAAAARTAIGATATGSSLITAVDAPAARNAIGAAPQAGLSVQTRVASSSTWAAYAGTSIIPYDDTLPLISEGAQVLSGSFTPRAASSSFEFEVSIPIMTSQASGVIAAVFVGSTCVGSIVKSIGGSFLEHLHFKTGPVSLTAGAHTISVRVGNAGADFGVIYLNGSTTSRVLGGALSSVLTATEYMV